MYLSMYLGKVAMEVSRSPNMDGYPPYLCPTKYIAHQNRTRAAKDISTYLCREMGAKLT